MDAAALHILVVEDEPAIADNIRYALETDGFIVDWVSTGQEAHDALAGNTPALVILDVGLPDINGFDLCRQLRESSDVPVVFLTARADEIDRIVGLEIGGDDYVTKPFSPRELTARVRAILRRTKHDGASVISPDDDENAADVPFAVDEHRKQIRFRDRALPLSRYEYRLLKLLLSRPGWVFSREQLMQHVWEEPEASMDRTVDTHIKTIRAKLRSTDPDADPIQTHRGLGYSLREMA